MDSAPSKAIATLRGCLRLRYQSLRWKLLKKFNREKYLQDSIDISPDDDPDWESIDELLFLQTTKWVKRGRKVNISVTDIPLPKESDTHWETGSHGEKHLPWDVLRKYRRLVEDAEYENARRRREGKELWVKYLTMTAAILAALASLGNLYLNVNHK